MTFEKSNFAEEKSDFAEINLSETKRKKLPKRLVHFSDGVLEEYSTDEEIEEDKTDSKSLVDPKSLPWVPYIGHMMWWLGSRTLAVCDYLGENLAWYLGITSPKFQYEIDQYEKMVKEEEEFEKQIKAESVGWCIDDTESKSKSIVDLQPHVTAEDHSSGIKFDDLFSKSTHV